MEKQYSIVLKRPLSAYLPVSCGGLLGLVMLAILVMAMAQGYQADYRIIIMLVISILLSVLGIYFLLVGITYRLTLFGQEQLEIKNLHGTQTYHINDVDVSEYTDGNGTRLMIKDLQGKTLCYFEKKAVNWQACRDQLFKWKRHERRKEQYKMLFGRYWYSPCNQQTPCIFSREGETGNIVLVADSKERADCLAMDKHELHSFNVQELVDFISTKPEWSILFHTEDEKIYEINELWWEEMKEESPQSGQGE